MKVCNRCKTLEIHIKRLCAYIDAVEDEVISIESINKLKKLEGAGGTKELLEQLEIE
jgi:hypothetical protein